MFGPWVLNEIWITNLSSALIGMLMSSSKLFLFSKEVHFISGVPETVIGIALCCCHQARCLLYYFGKINSGIHMYFTPLFSDVVVVSDLNKNFGRSTDLAKKRHGSADLHTPIHPPLYDSVFLQFQSPQFQQRSPKLLSLSRSLKYWTSVNKTRYLCIQQQQQH